MSCCIIQIPKNSNVYISKYINILYPTVTIPFAKRTIGHNQHKPVYLTKTQRIRGDAKVKHSQTYTCLVDTDAY
jgi:hypothetical protein